MVLMMTIFFMFAFCVAWFLRTNTPSYRTFKMCQALPGPKGYPILGNALDFVNIQTHEIFGLLEKYRQKYGKVYRFWFAGISTVMINDPKDLEVAMGSTTHITKGSQYEFLTDWLKEGLLLSTGLKWHKRRKILTPTFHFRILEEILPVMNHYADQLGVKIMGLGDSTVNISPMVSCCTLQIICEAAMGVRLVEESDVGQLYIKSVKRISEIIAQRLINLKWANDLVFNILPIGFEYRECLKNIHSFTKNVIKDRRKSFNLENTSYQKCRPFLDCLIAIDINEPGTLKDSDIQEEVDTFMFEGHDTTYAAIMFTCFSLGQYPNIQDQVRQELYEIFGDDREREVTRDDLSKMVYLEKVIKETLRLYPSVGFITRGIKSDLIIDNTTIPEGTTVGICIYNLHRDSKLFPNPEVFHPERFNDDENVKRHPYAYIPFSAGPRNCIGQKFAMMELKVVLSTLLRRAKISSVTKPDGVFFHPDLILRPSTPLLMKFTPIQ